MCCTWKSGSYLFSSTSISTFFFLDSSDSICQLFVFFRLQQSKLCHFLWYLSLIIIRLAYKFLFLTLCLSIVFLTNRKNTKNVFNYKKTNEQKPTSLELRRLSLGKLHTIYQFDLSIISNGGQHYTKNLNKSKWIRNATWR